MFWGIGAFFSRLGRKQLQNYKQRVTEGVQIEGVFFLIYLCRLWRGYGLLVVAEYGVSCQMNRKPG